MIPKNPDLRARRWLPFAAGLSLAPLLALAVTLDVAARGSATGAALLYEGIDCSAFHSGNLDVYTQEPVDSGSRFFIGYNEPVSRAVFEQAPLPEGATVDKLPPIAVDDTGIFDGAERYVPVLRNDVSDQLFDLSSLRLTADSGRMTIENDGTTLTVANEGRWFIQREAADARFTANEGFTGTPTPVRYQVSDTDGLASNLATITLQDRHPPILASDEASFRGGVTTIDVLKNDIDSDGVDEASVRFALDRDEFSSDLVLADGQWRVTRGGRLEYTPAAGFTGEPTGLAYVAADPRGNYAPPQTVTLHDRAAPVLDDVSANFFGGAVRRLAYGSDAHGEVRARSVVRFVGTDAAGEGTSSVLVTGEGEWTSYGEEVTFTPAAGYTDTPTPQRLRVLDDERNASNVVEFALVDRAPPAVADDRVESYAAGPVVVDVLANDGIGPRRFADSLALVCPPDGALISADGQSMVAPGVGLWTIDSARVRFLPEPLYAGEPVPARYGLADEHGNAAAAEVIVSYADGVLPGDPPGPPGRPATPADPGEALWLPALLELVLSED